MWWNKHIGRKFASKGRAEEVDCWGLVMQVYAEERGISLPGFEGSYNSTEDYHDMSRIVLEESGRWRPVMPNKEAEFDIIIMRLRGLPVHVGLVTRKGRMLHCLEGVGVSHEPYNNLRWQSRIIGMVRHEAAA